MAHGPELTQKLACNLERYAGKKTVTWEKWFRNLLSHYSLTVNLIKSLWKRVTRTGQSDADPHAMSVGGNIHTSLCPAKASHRDIYALMSPGPNEEGFWFADNPIARENKSALLAFRDFAARNRLPLIVVLLPVGPMDDLQGGDGLNPEHYREVRDFLDAEGIRFVDLTLRLLARGWKASELYWKHDAHFSPMGNRAIAEALIEEFPRLFSK